MYLSAPHTYRLSHLIMSLRLYLFIVIFYCQLNQYSLNHFTVTDHLHLPLALSPSLAVCQSRLSMRHTTTTTESPHAIVVVAGYVRGQSVLSFRVIRILCRHRYKSKFTIKSMRRNVVFTSPTFHHRSHAHDLYIYIR